MLFGPLLPFAQLAGRFTLGKISETRSLLKRMEHCLPDMMNPEESQLIFYDKMKDARIVALIMLIVSVILFLLLGEDGWPVLIFGGLGLLLFLFISDLTMIADRPSQTLWLEYRSVLKTSVKEIPFAEIAEISVERSRRRKRGRTRIIYRILVTLQNGKTIPFRSYYASVPNEKEKQVSALRAFIWPYRSNFFE